MSSGGLFDNRNTCEAERNGDLSCIKAPMDLAAVVEGSNGEMIGVFGVPKGWEQHRYPADYVPPRAVGQAVCAYDKCNGVCGGDLNANGEPRACRDHAGGRTQCCVSVIEAANSLLTCEMPAAFDMINIIVGDDIDKSKLRVAYVKNGCKRSLLPAKYASVKWQGYPYPSH